MLSTKLRISALIGSGLLATSAGADSFEERSWTIISQLSPSPFQINPAALPTEDAILSFTQMRQSREAKYIYNPDNNPAKVEHKTETKDIAFGGQTPLGGASAGLLINQYHRSISARHENRGGNAREEEFWVRDHKLKFVVDLTADFRVGFGFRYQALESDLLGSHSLNDQDRTRFKGSRSGYSLGGFYQLKGMGIGLFTARPLRGKAVIESEQKIITDPGHDGLEFVLELIDKLKVKVAAVQWSYKRDDRDDDSTSPVDQRGILLRGLEIDQYYRKTRAIALGGEYLLTPIAAAKLSFVKQEGVFLFDATALPGKRNEVETPMDYTELRGGVALRNKEFMAEIMLSRSNQKKDSILVQRNEVGVGRLGSFDAKETAVLLSVGAIL